MSEVVGSIEQAQAAFLIALTDLKSARNVSLGELIDSVKAEKRGDYAAGNQYRANLSKGTQAILPAFDACLCAGVPVAWLHSQIKPLGLDIVRNGPKLMLQNQGGSGWLVETLPPPTMGQGDRWIGGTVEAPELMTLEEVMRAEGIPIPNRKKQKGK